MDIKVETLDISLRRRHFNGDITLAEAARELHKAGWFNYVPTEEQTLFTIYR